ncbi:MAG TPA: restriction endonuclease subunit S [Erysipelotrichaceae bacterium]|nr:restriction endonuclease subunit S [Erysipelotrichaceae bacterium]
MENNKTPSIRFKGFTDPWEQRKLGDIADIVGGGTPSTNNADYWDGDIDWYAPAEIGDKIFVDSSERKITKEGFENCSAKLLPAGSVLFTSRAGIGKMAILRKESCTNQGFQSIVPHEGELDSYFIFSRSDELKNYGETVGAGSTFVEVSGKQMSNMNLMMPKSYSEQIVIGKYFSQLDDLITLHQRKYNKLLNVKKSMLEKMFPKNGSNIPEIRFKGFTDPWEQRKFGDGMDLLTGFPFESEKFSGNGINLIRGMNVKRGYLDLSDSLCKKWKSSEGLEKYLLENEDILIQMDGALIGKSYAKIKESQLPALLVQRVTRARAIPEESNSDFMYQTIQRDFLKYIILNKTDSAVPHLSLNDIREFPIRVPNLEEQKKIGEYLSNLDNLITLHQRELEKLQNIKKSMLEKMFV